MKAILRASLGTLFLLFFLLALSLGAVKTKLLQEKFWTGAVEKSGAYTQLLANVDDLQKQSDTITQTKGLARIKIAGILTPARLSDLVTTNIQYWLAFLNGHSTALMAYLPF